MKVDMSIPDAGYCTAPNLDELYGANIDWLTRLPDNTSIYRDLVRNQADALKRSENLVQYLDRYVYIKQVPVKIGAKLDHQAHAYLGYDVERAADETRKVTASAMKNKQNLSQVGKRLDKAGYFVLLTSLCYTTEDILPAYYTRQLVEQYFDIGKGISKLTPLRIHSEEALRGHLLLSMIASTINVYVQKLTKKAATERTELFMSLRNQKCIVYKSKIMTGEPQRIANELYSKAGIKCPISMDRSEGKLVLQYHLAKACDSGS